MRFWTYKYKMLSQLEIVGLGFVLKEKAPTESEGDEEHKETKRNPMKQDKEMRVKNLISMSLSDRI